MTPSPLPTALAAALLALTNTPAMAQETAAAPAKDAILVLDASGSMWGRIDDVPRIEIARDVISGLLDGLPPSQRLGLVAYGHNRKGDCADIETLVDVGTDRDAIRAAVDGINPKGMTPMTAAVKQAAETLKYSENTATVILVSDGLETCGLDPCAVATALEDSGVALTVHTVGFGLGEDEKEAKAQLACMAANTGGRALLASDSTELAAALQEVSTAAAPEPAPEPVPPAVETVEVRLVATDQDGGPRIEEGLAWTVRHGATGEAIFESAPGAGIVTADIPRGVHDVSVKRTSDGATAEGEVKAGAGNTSLTLPIVVELAASVEAPATATAGSEVRVVWTGPDEPNDYIAVATPDAAGSSHINYTRTRDGNPLKVKLPDDAGNYEIRYVSRKTRDVLARQAIEATPASATLEVPTTAAAGSTIRVAWTGPDYSNDYIAIATPGTPGSKHLNYTRTTAGNPLELKLPDAPGSYEVRYILRQSRGILASAPIEATPVSATLQIPATATAGSKIRVTWTGPDYPDDYIAIAEPGARGSSHIKYTHTRRGNPLELALPDEPGQYEVRYILRQSRSILDSKPIEVR